ncbi:MAG: hypothetical protein HKN29_10525, partial [Rhodothermales bacterium]|nr:hypothetical protein [Rhodothermales bacterium]
MSCVLWGFPNPPQATKRVLSALLLLVLSTGSAFAQYALQYGAAVAVAGDDVIVGEGRNLLVPGTAFVYSPDADGAYHLTAQMSPGDGGEDGFGRSMDGSGDTVVIGAPAAGAVYV